MHHTPSIPASQASGLDALSGNEDDFAEQIPLAHDPAQLNVTSHTAVTPSLEAVSQAQAAAVNPEPAHAAPVITSDAYLEDAEQALGPALADSPHASSVAPKTGQHDAPATNTGAAHKDAKQQQPAQQARPSVHSSQPAMLATVSNPPATNEHGNLLPDLQTAPQQPDSAKLLSDAAESSTSAASSEAHAEQAQESRTDDETVLVESAQESAMTKAENAERRLLSGKLRT